MSQYLISPPPVYARNWANSQNLVESTKIERQIVASEKVQRKEKEEKKKEKKGEKKEKKEKKPRKEKKDKSLKQQYILIPTKQVSDESEQIEKSCLTEEHEQPLHVGYLSDGSQNSKKRIRESSPAVESNIKATPVAGNPLRIRILLKKPKVAEVVPQEDRVCSISATERHSEVRTIVPVSKTCDHAENLVSTSLETHKIEISSESKKRKKHKPSKEARYNTLFGEWVPPCVMLEDNSSSDDWLFGTRRQENASTKAPIKNDEDMITNLQTSGDCSFLPRPRFLSEVGIFSLPYTVPF